MKTFQKIITLFLTLTLIAAQCPALFAQEAGYIEDDGAGLWEEQEFLDTTGREFETQDTQYVGEDEIKAAEDAAARAGLPSVNLVAALERDKEMMPDNLTYGVITGAALGAWFAMLQGSSARDNARYLSLGVLSGALLAMIVGTKSLYSQPTTPLASLNNRYELPTTGLSQASAPAFTFGVADTGKDLGATVRFETKF